MGDMADLAREMEHAADEADHTGLCMDEYEEFGFPPEHKDRVRWAMSKWANGCCDLRQAAKEMADILKEI